MNAAVRAVVRSAIKKNMQVMGVRRGYNGLINGDMSEMNIRSVSNVLHRGGTMLLTARCNEFKTEEGQNQAVEVCKQMGIDGMVIIGGDGSFMGARALSLKGIPCIGIPGTIDNDIACTDYTIGFDTALNTAVEAIDRLRDTSESHDRCSVVEVMGHGAGHLALYASVACGGTACWVNEIGFDVDRDVIEKINSSIRTGKHNFIVIVSEGITDVHHLARYIEEKNRRRIPCNRTGTHSARRNTNSKKTELLLARWAAMRLTCWNRVSATVLSSRKTQRLLTTIFWKH